MVEKLLKPELHKPDVVTMGWSEIPEMDGLQTLKSL